MIKKIKSLLNTGDNQKIFSNFLSLSILQGANLLLPLLTFPYLVRVLGVEKYGLVFFAQAFITYFSLLANYGFNLSGVREISSNQNNQSKVESIVNSIMQLRIGLVIVGFILMATIVLGIEKFTEDWELYFLTYGIVLGNALFPIWFFQGVQKMKYITILSLIAKSIFTVFIFLLVNSPEDYLWVPVLNSLGYLFVGFISLFILIKQFGISFKLQNIISYREQLNKGWFIFISNMSTNLYTATTTFVLGLVTNNTLVGYYVIAEKVIRIVQGLFNPLNQSIYPHFVQLVKKSKKASLPFIKKILAGAIVTSTVVWGVGFVFTEPLFNLVFNKDVDESIYLFRILSPLMIVLPVAGILFQIVLLSFDMDKHFFKIYAFGGILNIFLLGLFLFVMELETVGACLSLVLCESLITLYAVIILYKNDFRVFNFLPNKRLQEL